MASFDIVPIEQGDNDPLTRIGYQAFADDLLNKRLYNLVDPTPEQVEEDLQWRINRNGRRMYSAGSHWVKALESTTGKPVGYSGILAPEKGKPKGLDTDDSVMPATLNKELYALIGEKGKALRKQHLGERDDYWCEFRPLCPIHTTQIVVADTPKMCRQWQSTQTIKAMVLRSGCCKRSANSQMKLDRTYISKAPQLG
jgi:hypothetical protein